MNKPYSREEFIIALEVTPPADEGVWLAAVAGALLTVSLSPDSFAKDPEALVHSIQLLASTMPTKWMAAGTAATTAAEESLK